MAFKGTYEHMLSWAALLASRTNQNKPPGGGVYEISMSRNFYQTSIAPFKKCIFFPFQVVWHDGVRELPNSWQWLVEHDNGTGSNQKEINVELSRINLGLPLICKVNSSALDAPISKKIHGLWMCCVEFQVTKSIRLLFKGILDILWFCMYVKMKFGKIVIGHIFWRLQQK